MKNDKVKPVCVSEANMNDVIDGLLKQIRTGDNPGKARDLLTELKERFPEDSPDSLSALTYYRGMHASLSEEDFRWLSFNDKAKRKSLRRARLSQYQRWRELFEIEVHGALRLNYSTCIMLPDWSHLLQYASSAVRVVRSTGMLRLAALLYSAQIPGALDVCDAAAFDLFRSAYL